MLLNLMNFMLFVKTPVSKDTEDLRRDVDKLVLESKADDCEKMSYKDFSNVLESMKK